MSSDLSHRKPQKVVSLSERCVWPREASQKPSQLMKRWRGCKRTRGRRQRGRERMIDEDKTRGRATSSCVIVLTPLLYGSTSCETGKCSWRLSPPAWRAAGSGAAPEAWSEPLPRPPRHTHTRTVRSKRRLGGRGGGVSTPTKLISKSVYPWGWRKNGERLERAGVCVCVRVRERRQENAKCGEKCRKRSRERER